MSRPWRAVPGLVLCGSMAFAAPQHAALEKAQKQHAALEFEDCLRSLDRAARHFRTAQELSQVSLWRGLCAAGLDDVGAALEHFRLARQLDPAVALPPLSPPKVVELFGAAGPRAPVPLPSDSPMAEPGPATAAPSLSGPSTAPAPAPTVEPVATHTVRPAPSASGPRPWALYVPLGVAGVATGLSVLWGRQASGLERDANAASYADDSVALGDRARGAALRSNVAAGVAVVSAASALAYWLWTRDGDDAGTPPPEAAP